ncbi:hypothetical protein [Pseudomonas veronii]|uniref:hypothetical protein n=1 Tax=Pseudomonas veronii TaxID=76761 RepID=UPI000F8304F7|nr:hypothetical protein [Pseudomonas veronii]RTY75529.1 hypothetical protein EKA83_15675 [Pseudomonas veronii]
MTYVREQSSTELAVHMRSLQKMPGWHDPLADRLWQEVEALKAEVAGLRTGYEAYERVKAELKAEVEKLRAALTYIRDTSDDWHVCEKAADALADAALGQGGDKQ